MTVGKELKHQSTMQELFMVSSQSLLDLSACQEELSTLSVVENSISDETCSTKDEKSHKELDLHAYMARRVMSPLQERVNAITMIPNPLYCWYYILAGLWINSNIESDLITPMDDSECMKSIWFPNMTALPPPTVTAVAIGITLHAPFSFLYHYRYAHALDPIQRVLHWSRRMDHSAIHACSAILSYATSDSWKYFLLNLAYNAYCIYCQFQPKVSGIRYHIHPYLEWNRCSDTIRFYLGSSSSKPNKGFHLHAGIHNSNFDAWRS
jgi:hypothetical protein